MEPPPRDFSPRGAVELEAAAADAAAASLPALQSIEARSVIKAPRRPTAV